MWDDEGTAHANMFKILISLALLKLKTMSLLLWFCNPIFYNCLVTGTLGGYFYVMKYFVTLVYVSVMIITLSISYSFSKSSAEFSHFGEKG